MSPAYMGTLTIGIAGGSGSGKTTIAQKLHQSLGARSVIIEHDSYYKDQSDLTPQQRAQINYDHPDSLDNELLVQHVAALQRLSAVETPIYDFTSHTRCLHTRRIEPASVIIVEGILVLADENIRNLMDIRVFVDTDADIRLMRRIRRDLEQRGRSFSSVRSQYYNFVRPMHRMFVEPSKQWADLIIPEGGENQIALDVLIAAIMELSGRQQKSHATM